MLKPSWKDYVLELFTNYLAPLEGAYDPHGWTQVENREFRLNVRFTDSSYAFILQGTLEASYWLVILDLDPQDLFKPSNSESWPITVTGETLTEAFQILHEAIADLQAETRQG